jgi:hypothetical protein
VNADKEIDINAKLQIFKKICGTVIRTFAGNARKETLLKFIRLWE